MMTSHLWAASVLRTKPVACVGKKLGDLVLEAFPALGRERHVVRVGADPEHLGINELDRPIRAFDGLREQFSG